MDDNAIIADPGCGNSELGCSGLPDSRLGQCLRKLSDQISSSQEQAVPAACGDWAAPEVAYRFSVNTHVTEYGVLAGHFAATAARC